MLTPHTPPRPRCYTTLTRHTPPLRRTDSAGDSTQHSTAGDHVLAARRLPFPTYRHGQDCGGHACMYHEPDLPSNAQIPHVSCNGQAPISECPTARISSCVSPYCTQYNEREKSHNSSQLIKRPPPRRLAGVSLRGSQSISAKATFLIGCPGRRAGRVLLVARGQVVRVYRQPERERAVQARGGAHTRRGHDT